MPDSTISNVQWLIDAIASTLEKTGAGEEGVGETLARLGAQERGAAAFIRPEPSRLRACRHLPELIGASLIPAPGVAAAIAACDDDLRWVQNGGYGSDAILEDYAYCELIGPEGFFAGDDFLLGLTHRRPRASLPRSFPQGAGTLLAAHRPDRLVARFRSLQGLRGGRHDLASAMSRPRHAHASNAAARGVGLDA